MPIVHSIRNDFELIFRFIQNTEKLQETNLELVTPKQANLKTNMNNPSYFRNTGAQVWKHLGHWVGSAKNPTTHFSKCMAQASQQTYSIHAQAPQVTEHLQHLTANHFQKTKACHCNMEDQWRFRIPPSPSAPPLSHRDWMKGQCPINS